jgi:hypothetical protein
MGILLLVIVVLVSLALTVRAWRGYEAAFRRNPGDGFDSVGPIPGEPFDDFSSSNDASQTHHGGTDCGGFHHGGCDAGHGNFDGGGHH